MKRFFVIIMLTMMGLVFSAGAGAEQLQGESPVISNHDRVQMASATLEEDLELRDIEDSSAEIAEIETYLDQLGEETITLGQLGSDY